MAVNLAPGPFGAGYQAFDANGRVLNAGLLNTYAAGTTSPAPTFTTSAGNVQNANPIVLGTDGRPPQEIWLTAGVAYKFVLTDSLSNLIGTYDNLVGINDISTGTSSIEWTASGLTPTFISTTQFSVPGNQTAVFTTNLRTKTANTGGTIYSTVSAQSYSAGPNTTTVTVVNDSGVLDSGLSSVSYGFLNSVNPSMPPYSDVQIISANASDPTKRLKLSISQISTATVLVLGVANVSNVVLGKQPTRSTITSGTAATYTTPGGATRINVRLVGGGGGGSANVTNPGTAGNSTTFGTLTGSGGAQGNTTGAGGAGGGASGGDINIPGGGGQGGVLAASATQIAGGKGGDSVFGGGGASQAGNNGGAGATNSGGGGAGGAATNVDGSQSGSGGGAGGYVEKLFVSPSPTYTYTVGGTANGGAAGNFAGGAGAAGIIIVDEYYN